MAGANLSDVMRELGELAATVTHLKENFAELKAEVAELREAIDWLDDMTTDENGQPSDFATELVNAFKLAHDAAPAIKAGVESLAESFKGDAPAKPPALPATEAVETAEPATEGVA